MFEGQRTQRRNATLPEYEDSNGEEIQATLEAPWDGEKEQYAKDRASEAFDEATKHGISGKNLQTKHNVLGVIVLLNSSTVFVANSLISCGGNDWTKILLVFIAAVNLFFSTLFSQLNLVQKSRKHYEYEAKFVEFYEDISYQLTLDREFREPADAFMKEIRERKKRLTDAPPFSRRLLYFC